MRCEELEQAWKSGPSADAVAHIASCDRCAATVVARVLSEAPLPTPPRGFAHLTALRAIASASSEPAAAASHRIVGAVLSVGLGLLVAAMSLWLLEAHTSTAVSMIASAGTMVVLEAVALSAAIIIWAQAPPLRRHA